MSRRLTRIVLSVIVGAAGVGIGLYFGRFIALGAGYLFKSSYPALALASSTAWWLFIGLLGGIAFAFSAVRRNRVRFGLLTVAGFALGGVIAAVPEMSRLDRSSAVAVLAVPLGGALAGAFAGLGARLGVRAAATAIAGAAAMYIARPYLISSLPPSDWIALLLPGALIGAALAALAPERAASKPQ